MKSLLIVLAIALTVNGYPAELDDVEVFDPVNTNSKDAGGSNETVFGGLIPIIVIRWRPLTGFGYQPSYYDYGFDSPVNDDSGSDENTKQTGVTSEESPFSGCGIVCHIFKSLESPFKTFEETFNKTSTSSNNTDSPYIFNSTYTEKLLPDGSILKINQTFAVDTSDDAKSLFFHSTSYHNVGDSLADDEDEDNDYQEEEEGSFEHEFTPKDESSEEKINSETSETEKKDPSVSDLSPESYDEENEIDAGKSKTEERLVLTDAAQ